MVFVHSRKDTWKTAQTMYEMATDEGCTDLLDPSFHENYQQALRDLKTSKGRELRELVPKGFGTHHAGMPRSDRNLMERLFADGVLKVLCCTATLAWGVNLPAAAVVIKGTQLYSSEAGKFVDLGILDVLHFRTCRSSSIPGYWYRLYLYYSGQGSTLPDSGHSTTTH